MTHLPSSTSKKVPIWFLKADRAPAVYQFSLLNKLLNLSEENIILVIFPILVSVWSYEWLLEVYAWKMYQTNGLGFDNTLSGMAYWIFPLCSTASISFTFH